MTRLNFKVPARVAFLAAVFVLVLVLTNGVTAQTDGRLNIAVMDLQMSGGVSESYKLTLSDRLRTELFSTGRFKVLERNAMIEVLSEQGLQMSGCTSDECAVEAGRLLGVRRIIAGSLGKVGQTHSINIRMIDVETGEIIDTRNVDCQCPIDEVLSTRIRQAARLIAGLDAGAVTTTTTAMPVTAAGKGDLFVKSEPDGAVIYLDEKAIEGNTPKVIESISAGMHNIRLQKDDMVGSGTVFITAGIIANLEITLKKGKAALRIYSKPFEAMVSIDGKQIGTTPQVIENLTAGNHKVYLKHNGYMDHEETVRLSVSEEKRLDIDMIRALGEILVEASVSSGTVSINGESRQTGFPTTFKALEPGEYRIEVSAPDHDSFKKTVRVKVGKSQKIKAELYAHRGTLDFSGLPDGTEVILDSSSLGTTPIIKKSLMVGEYRVKLKRSGYEPGKVQNIHVRNKTAAEVTFSLKPKSKGRAVLKSMFWPGRGQSYHDRKGAGIRFTYGGIASVGFLTYAILNYNAKANDYNNVRREYLDAGGSLSEVRAAYNNAESAQDDANSAKTMVNIAAGAAVGLYLWNIIDVIIYSPKAGTNLSFNPQPRPINLSASLLENTNGNYTTGLSLNIIF